ALRIPAPACLRVDPHLLELHRARRPRRRLRLEEDDAVLVEPDPRPALLDLRARTPAEALRIAAERVDPDLLLVRGRARGDEPLVVRKRRRTQSGLARLRRVAQLVHGLTRPVVARRRQPPLDRLPQRADRALLADDHPRLSAHDRIGEAERLQAARDDVRADVAERLERTVVADERVEAPEPAARDVLEEHALDGLLGAELEDLLHTRLGQLHHYLVRIVGCAGARPPPSRSRRLRGLLPAPRRPRSGAVDRGDVPRGRGAGERRT